jgi:hypothetical protein
MAFSRPVSPKRASGLPIVIYMYTYKNIVFVSCGRTCGAREERKGRQAAREGRLVVLCECDVTFLI